MTNATPLYQITLEDGETLIVTEQDWEQSQSIGFSSFSQAGLENLDTSPSFSQAGPENAFTKEFLKFIDQKSPEQFSPTGITNPEIIQGLRKKIEEEKEHKMQKYSPSVPQRPYLKRLSKSQSRRKLKYLCSLKEDHIDLSDEDVYEGETGI